MIEDLPANGYTKLVCQLITKKRPSQKRIELDKAAAEHLGAKEMTERYYADYNNNTPAHPMTAPVGVDYVFAVRE